MRKLFFTFIILFCLSNSINAQTCYSLYNFSTNGLTATFTDSSFTNTGNISYFWDFDDSTTSTAMNPVHTYAQAGSYYVCLSITTSVGCRNTFCDTVTVSAPVPCQTSFSYMASPLGSVSFTNNTIPLSTYSYQWDFGDGSPLSTAINPSHQYINSGVYTVTLTASGFGMSCTFTDSVVITNTPNQCIALFSYQQNPLPLGGVTFTNLSTSPGAAGTSYTWDFGNGSTFTQTGTNPVTHNYSSSGTYIVTLTMSNSLLGCTSSYTDSVVFQLIIPPPSCYAGFTYSINQDTIYFQNTASNNATNIYYDFGDATNTTLSDPTHIYSQSGTYVVCQIISDSANICSDTLCDTIVITVPPPCQANFTYTTNNEILTILDRGLNYSTVSYDFGDGTTSLQANPMHVYMNSGKYEVCQTVSNNRCTNTFCDSVTINIPPPCQAGFTFNVNQDTATFMNLASNFTNVSYSFGDGSHSSLENPVHVYAQSGTYIVQQVVIDSLKNCADTLSDTLIISITPPCIAGFTFSILGDSVLFQNSSSSFNRVVYYFGDGDSSINVNPIHAYQRSGAFIVKQFVYNDSINCVDIYTDTITVTVSMSCVAGFVVAIDTNNLGTLFLVNISSNDNTHTYFWNFGDGTTGSGRTPTHQYALNQRHNICLTVSDTVQNCTSTYCEFVGLDSNGQILKTSGYKLRVINGTFIGIEENSVFDELSIYPNPTRDQISIDQNLNYKVLKYSLLNAEGRIIKNGVLKERINQLDLNNYPQGIYFLKLYNENDFIVKRILKQ